jgi:hypothetical protein
MLLISASVMRRHRSTLMVGMCVLFAVCGRAARATPPQSAPANGVNLTPELPHEVELADPADPTQLDFDVFSWKSFVALNWPATADGKPISGAAIGLEPNAPRVWESFVQPGEVFLSSGTKPRWAAPKGFGQALQTTKAATDFHGVSLDALHFPVIDQDKNFILFDIRLNRDEFDYIVSRGLNSRKGQAGADPLKETFVSFPSGAKNGPVGAIEIKTAWRIFPSSPANPLMARYFTRPATLKIDKEHSATGQPLQLNVTLGLVGFHIAHKTKGQPEWVWSTFEHVDNFGTPPNGKPTLIDPSCTNCPPNNRPLPPGVPVPAEPDEPVKAPRTPYKWSATPPFAAPNQRIPVQAQRLTPLKAATTELNSEWQQALRRVNTDSVWQYYQLISTQWPLKPFARKPGQLPGAPGPGNPTVAQFEGEPTPRILANIPIETYNQSSSSCIHCHGHAMTTNGDYADFSFLLLLAK